MKKTKRRRKLLIQTALIMIPVFILMIAAVAQTVYISSVNSYLEGQKIQIEDMMNTMLTSFVPYGTDVKEYLWDWTAVQLENMPVNQSLGTTEEEQERYMEYFDKDNRYKKGWYDEMPSDVGNIYQGLPCFCKGIRRSDSNGRQFRRLFYHRCR